MQYWWQTTLNRFFQFPEQELPLLCAVALDAQIVRLHAIMAPISLKIPFRLRGGIWRFSQPQFYQTLDFYRLWRNVYSKLFLTYCNLFFSVGFYYIQGCVFLLFIDACLSDDEPLWEPVEWSLLQTWILVIFLFGWIAENLITSRYGAYTGRDKHVWVAWYKTFWLIELYYMLSFAAAAAFVILPFYFELNYALPFIHTWWSWYTRAFFFKFIVIFSIVLLLAHLLQVWVRWAHWHKLLVLVVLVNFFLSYLLYTHFMMSFFGYITDPIWYQRNRSVDYIQLSHEPAKWGWGEAGRDHFTYHKTCTRFWFKNDGPFAATLMLFNMYIFFSLFCVYIYWIALFRRIYSTGEAPLTYTVYCISALRQFFYAFLYLYFFIFLSFMTSYWRLPIELTWGLNQRSWLYNAYTLIQAYPTFLHQIIFLDTPLRLLSY